MSDWVPDTIPDETTQEFVVYAESVSIGRRTLTEVGRTQAIGPDQALIRLAELDHTALENKALVAISAEAAKPKRLKLKVSVSATIA